MYYNVGILYYCSNYQTITSDWIQIFFWTVILDLFVFDKLNCLKLMSSLLKRLVCFVITVVVIYHLHYTENTILIFHSDVFTVLYSNATVNTVTVV